MSCLITMADEKGEIRDNSLKSNIDPNAECSQTEDTAPPVSQINSGASTQIGTGNKIINNPKSKTNDKYIINHYYLPPNLDGNVIINCHCKASETFVHKLDNHVVDDVPHCTRGSTDPIAVSFTADQTYTHGLTYAIGSAQRQGEYESREITRVRTRLSVNNESKTNPSAMKPYSSISRSFGRRGTRKSLAMETQEASSKSSGNVRVLDSEGRELQPGDIVWVVDFYAVYETGLELIWCSPESKKVERKALDLSEPFYRYTPYSIGRCAIADPKERTQKALRCLEVTCPVGETSQWWGLDFVSWICTDLTRIQAWRAGFRLWK